MRAKSVRTQLTHAHLSLAVRLSLVRLISWQAAKSNPLALKRLYPNEA